VAVSVAFAALLATGVAVAAGAGRDRLAAYTAELAPADPASDVDARAAGRTIVYPPDGPRRWRYATGTGPGAGRAGRLLRYRVAVEEGIAGVSPDGFAGAVTATLSDPRSWTAGGRWRLQPVGRTGTYDFTVYLATPGTRDRLCAMGYDRYTSCRNGDRVVINVARWARGVPQYRGALATYRQYVVNHEVGHRLGQRHERCPGKGRPAPTMQQQTLGLHGCRPNPWPFRAGRRYAGPPGHYGDRVPRA